MSYFKSLKIEIMHKEFREHKKRTDEIKQHLEYASLEELDEIIVKLRPQTEAEAEARIKADIEKCSKGIR